MQKNRWARITRDADPGATPPVTGGGAPPAPPATEPPKTDPPASDDFVPTKEAFLALKAEKAKAAADRDEATKKLQEIEDAKLSKEDKLTKDNAAATEKATAAELKVLKLEVALDKGLTTKQAMRLVGATKEELEADADDLRETFASPADRLKKKPAGGGNGNLKPGGGDNDGDSEALDPKKLADEVLKKSIYAR
jgi:hypothetical protein